MHFYNTSKEHFTLGVMTKQIQELNNLIGGELKIGPKGLYTRSRDQSMS
jgi:hypothetical protein